MNAEYQLKSKLTRPVCPKSMKLKQNRAGAMTAAKNAVLLGYNLRIVVLWGVELNFGGRGEGIQIWWRGNLLGGRSLLGRRG